MRLTLGQTIRRRRVELGLSQAQLAAQAGISRSAVLRIESDKSEPSAATVIALARALQVEIEFLFSK